MRRSLLYACIALALAGCGGSAGSSSSPTSASSTSTTAAASGSGGCRTATVPPPKGTQHLSAPTLRLDPRRTYTITMPTNCGTFAIRLDVKDSPKTSASFYFLAMSGFFNGLTFHRVAAGFVIQGGDPTGSGAGGPGYTVVEPPPKNTQYVRGDVAMAKTQTDPPGASGSQFFIVTAANATRSAGLTPDYALVGKVVSGMDAVERIGSLPTNPPQDGAPNPPVLIGKLRISVR